MPSVTNVGRSRPDPLLTQRFPCHNPASQAKLLTGTTPYQSPQSEERIDMPSIAAVLKQEITRLARKETKAGTDILRRANIQYRHDIAQLKRQVSALENKLSYLENQERKRALKPVPKTTAEGRRFSARGLKTHRDKVGLSAANYADLVGVSPQTIYNWEHGKSRPRDEQLPAIVAVRSLGKRDAVRRVQLLRG